MSALYIGDLEPWRHPTLCQFHYSDYWAETYRQLLDGRMRGCFLLDEDFPDPDIACHVRLTSESGICILGRPAEEVFPPVPEMDFWDSISRGIEETGPCVSSPRQIVADILNLVRVWSYGSEKRILSKYDAGVPGDLAASQTLPAYCGGCAACAVRRHDAACIYSRDA